MCAVGLGDIQVRFGAIACELEIGRVEHRYELAARDAITFVLQDLFQPR
jgi:hypothetical protein